ncbi:MAG: glycosyltransferase family 4 protein [candidate division WOR-3 bacterium]
MKKVLILGDFQSKHTILWFKSYSKFFDVYGFSLQKPMINSDKIFYIKTNVNSEKLKYFLSMEKLKEIYNQIKPQILHAHFIQNYGLMAYLLKKPYILSVWGRDLFSIAYKKFRNFISKQILKNAKIIHVDAYSLKWILVNNFNISPFKIINFPFGLETEILNKPLKSLKNETFRIVEFRKHINKIYNQVTILKAIKILKNKGLKNFKFFFLSRGKDSDYYKKLSHELEIEDFVEFLHLSHDEILNFLSESHIYVSASLVDSTSVSLLEAMNFGAFPIVSDIWANFEWIIDNFNGYLFNPLDEYDIAQKIEKAFDYKKIEKVRIINKEIVKQKANWEKNFEEFLKFINSEISENSLKIKNKFPWSYI